MAAMSIAVIARKVSVRISGPASSEVWVSHAKQTHAHQIVASASAPRPNPIHEISPTIRLVTCDIA